MKYKELKDISKKFKRHFLLDNIECKDNQIIKVQDEDEITFIAEIAKNIIKQGKEKLSQILNYLKIICIMNKLNKSYLVNDSNYKELCEDYKCKPNTEKIFCIITDGDYAKLNKTINFIKTLIEKSYSQEVIKNEINNFIANNSILFNDEVNKESLINNIYCVYLIFANLKINKIKHGLIYIGDVTNINYEEIFKNIINKDITVNQIIKGNNYEIIKDNYINLKIIIKKFEKNLSDFTIVRSQDINPIFLELQKEILSISKSSNCPLVKKIYNHIKFDAFIYYQKNDGENNYSFIRKKIDESQPMKELNNFFNLKITELDETETKKLINEVIKCPEQFGKKMIFLVSDINFLIDAFLDLPCFPPLVRNIYYVSEKKGKKEKINVYFNFSQNFMENLPIKYIANKIYDKEMKKIRKYFEIETFLTKENLPKKIISDFNCLFGQNKNNYPFVELINNTNFNIKEKNSLDEFIIYFKNAIELFEKISENLEPSKKSEIIASASSILEKLIDNVFASNVYSLIFKAIEESIGEIILISMQNKLLKYRVPPKKFFQK